ncbi:MAG: [FeFe] hydrogenase H-cluster maturation GTPase HydF, partial [Rikenellaceae bacterium]
RVAKALETLHHVDLAIIVFRGEWGSDEEKLLARIKAEGVDYIIVHNLFGSEKTGNYLESDLSTGERDRLMEAIKKALPEHSYKSYSMLGGRCATDDLVLLVCPIDSEAPSGRLILPQVQAIRDILDNNAMAVTLQPQQIPAFLALGVEPKVVVTDSQVIDLVKKSLPESLYDRLTTFSILLAELKGDVEEYKKGLKKAASLKQGDKILIMENCLHQTSCEDIGRVKIPRWLNEWLGCELDYTVVSGLSPLPENLEEYALVVQCGGCMVTPRQLKSRIRRVVLRGVSITNYGMLIKLIKG